ncbi:MAG: BON domain-containing protein [Candidatus Aminicenantes bacterium]|nr:BON domain-containing protein [Candidatus Aminicenantes bacterium]
MRMKYRIALAMSAAIVLMIAGSLGAQETDRRIESAFKSSYVFNVFLKGDDIQIHSQDGVVVLRGTVSEESHLSLAADTVADLPGVKSVDNRLEVKGGIPEKFSDAWIHLKISTMLMLHGNLDDADIRAQVKDGRVTLQGEYRSIAEKELTTEYVKDIEGVKDVKNEMTLTPTPPKARRTVGEFVDDASIKSQIKLALLFHRGTNAFGTEIAVDKGVVTVTGLARSAAEKELVTKRIEDIRGVKKIYNRMIVE